MSNKEANKSLDSFVYQYLNKVISFEDLLAVLKKRVTCISWKAAKAFQRFKPLYDVEDYESIVTIALLKALDRWNPSKAGFATYFEKVAYSEINDVRKAMTAISRQSNLETYSWEVDVLIEADEDSFRYDTVYQKSEFWIVYEQLGLTKQQDVICRLLSKGYKNKEIASRLGISEAAVSMSIKRLRKIFVDVVHT